MSEHLDAVIDRTVLEKFVETLRAAADESIIEFRPDEVQSNQCDAAQIALVDHTLSSKAFESYDCSGLRIGVNLERLEDYLGKADSDLVGIHLNMETRKFDLELGSVSVKMAGIDPDSVRKGVEISDGTEDGMECGFQIDGDAFDHAVSVVDMVSNHAQIDFDPDRDVPIQMIGEGDTDSTEIEFDNSLEDDPQIAGKGHSIYSIEYLERLSGVVPDGTTIDVQTGTEWPMVIDYEYAEGNSTVEMMMAPRIKTN